MSAMGRGLLVWNAFDRALFGPDRRTRQSLHHSARAFRIGDPFLIEVVWTKGLASYVLSRINLARVSTMDKLEQVILRLHVATRVTDQRLGKLRILNTHVLFAAFTQGPAIEADDGRMAEVRIDAVEPRGICYRNVNIVCPRHGLRHEHLLVLGRIHVSLTTYDKVRALHGAVTPNLRIIPVVADDEAYLQPLRTFGDVSTISGIPALNRHPRHDLPILLNDFAFVIHQNQGVVGRLVRMVLVPFAGEREHTPDLRLFASVGKNLCFLTRHARGGFIHLFRVVHDAVGAVFGKNHQIHTRQTHLHADKHLGNVPGIGKDLRLSMQARHFVIDDRNTDRVIAAADVTVKHINLLLVVSLTRVPRPRSFGGCLRY